VERAAVERATVERATVERATVERATVERATVERAAIERAVRQLDKAQQDRQWRFRLTILEDGIEKIVLNDPSVDKSQQRKLVSVAGKSPSKKELAAFTKEERKRQEESDKETNFENLIDLDSLRKTSEDNSLVSFSFTPRVDDLKDSEENLRASLVFNTTTQHIDSIEMTNTKPFSPAFSVSIEHYQLAFTFRSEQGFRVLASLHSTAKGKAGFLKSFNKAVDIAFSDYQPLPPSLPSVN